MVIFGNEEADGIPGELDLPAAGHRAASPTPEPQPSGFHRFKLHNFTFPTGSWGTHRILRCCNLSSDRTVDVIGRVPDAADRNVRADRKRPPSPPEKSSVKQKRSSGSRNSKEAEAERSLSSATAAEEVAGTSMPWSLRTRSAACKSPPLYRYSNSVSWSPSPLAAEKSYPATDMRKGRSYGSEKGERRKFCVSLSRKEIEEDFWRMKGTKPPRRPKKRARIVQRLLNSLFPGSRLSEVTSVTYKVDD
ncbi:uncharacterized protein LOC135618325 [Musa acuminata AAA Group]|uniref:uncharacterized protein LOC135618325 n=1 Tax=Musa acuminata AAA Group TaxID=214697 RepID=UPI0031D791B1